jgi:NADPH:quinone reductase-like Zn-dependent oxidoreductase
MDMPKKSVAMEVFRGLLEAGKLTPLIGKTFGLHEVVTALQCMQEGKIIGRLIVTPSADSPTPSRAWGNGTI